MIPRLSDDEIYDHYKKLSGLSNPYGRLQLIQIELSFRIIDELKKL